jgi:hypothetical protein
MKKTITILVVYLMFFITVPYLIFSIKFNKYSYSATVDYLGFYSHFIAPLLFFVAYWFAKPKIRKEKLIFIILGFIIPFGIIYTIAYLDFLKNFHPSF